MNYDKTGNEVLFNEIDSRRSLSFDQKLEKSRDLQPEFL